MKKLSDQSAKRVLIGLTLFLFVLGYLLVVNAGASEIKDLLGFLVSSYLVLWGGYSLVSQISRHEIRIQFVLMTLSLGIALFLIEVPAWFKWIDYRKTFSISSDLLWEQPGYQPDPELLAKPEPHRSVRMLFSRGNLGDALCLPTRQAEPFELRYDHNGFRNDEDMSSAEIAVVGDSYVESQMVPASVLATTRLAEATGKTVANLGQSGYGPQQELVVLKRYALPLHPHIVVWVFYEGNDLVDAQQYPDMVKRLGNKMNSMEMIWDRSFTKNALSWMMRFMKRCSPPAKLPAVAASVLDNEGQQHRVYIKGRSNSVSLTKQDLDALKESVTAIGEAYRIVHKEGARFIVVFAPTAFRVYHEMARFERAEKGIAPPWALDDLPDRLRKMVSEISPDIGYLDLTPALKSAARNNSLVFLSDDTHWSREGHQVVADTLAEAIKAESIMQTGMQIPEMKKAKEDLLLSSNAIMIRNGDGTIRYWSKGAQQLYGWEPDDALGMTSHLLLDTIFPVPLEVIEEELRVRGYWEGPLVHRRRDGSRITVSSRWNLQQYPMSEDHSMTVIEVNGPTNS